MHAWLLYWIAVGIDVGYFVKCEDIKLNVLQLYFKQKWLGYF